VRSRDSAVALVTAISWCIQLALSYILDPSFERWLICWMSDLCLLRSCKEVQERVRRINAPIH
jgi:hypothetical protein